jgi:sporulation protein YlmC with PRC-barrel domain
MSDDRTDQIENRLDDRFDAVLHLMDRQLIDVDGRMAGKVDDLELTEDDGRLVITSVLVGTTALLHRLGGRLGGQMVESHARLKPSEPHRDWPWRIPIGQVAYVDSAVHLDRRREGMLLRDRDHRRLGTLTGMRFHDPTGKVSGRVIDARFEPVDGRLVLRSLLVGRGGPGSLLGYDRHRDQGPALLGALIRAWHSNTREVDVDDVEIDWTTRRVTAKD